MSTIQLTRNEIIDLAIKNFIQQLNAEVERQYDIVNAKQKEVLEVQQQIKDYTGNTSKFDEMIEDLNVTCSRIVRKYGFGPLNFNVHAEPMYGQMRLTLRMGGKVSKEIKPKKAPVRLLNKDKKLRAEIKEATDKGFRMNEELTKLTRNNKEARQIILQKLADDQGISEQINELVGILVEADINPPSPPATI